MENLEIKDGVILTGEGIAVFRQLGLCVAADMHIGFEESTGQELAHLQTKMMLSKCVNVIKRFGLNEIVLNGDLKNSFGKNSVQEWNEIRFFLLELSKLAKIWIVKGNHDNYLENIISDIPLMMSGSFDINGVIFAHGDNQIVGRNGKLLVIGNEHPSIRLRDDIGAVRKYPCFLYAEKEQVLVLPALNPWAPGTDILAVSSSEFPVSRTKFQVQRFLSPVLNRIVLNNARVFAIESGSIFDFKKVKDVRKLLQNL